MIVVKKKIMRLNANNLYGWGMSQYLPSGRFEWLNKKEIDKFNVNSIECNSVDGYIVDVDLEYSDELHKIHNDYPLAPKKLKINHDMLSNYCSNISNDYRIKIGNVDKLVPNLGNKSRYVPHYQNRQFYLSLGVKWTKFHGILKFKQSDLLKNTLILI